MSNALAIITGEIANARDDFARVSVDQNINFERESGFAIQVLQNNEYALSCAMKNKQSVINAVTNIAAIGISLNPARKQAYLVPRDGKICLDISYMGLRDIAVASGSVLWAHAEIVREHDIYTPGKLGDQPTHEFKRFSKEAERGDIIGVYVVAKIHSGDFLVTEMSLEEVHRVRDRSEGWKAFIAKKIKSTPWHSDEGEMIKKTVIKRAYKGWPKTERMDYAMDRLNIDNAEGLATSETNQNYVDVAVMIAEAKQTRTDSEALAYWRSNNARLAQQPEDHKRLKAAIAMHRQALADAAQQQQDEERTIEMPPSDVPPLTDEELDAQRHGGMQ
jgi:recombination protein RecT